MMAEKSRKKKIDYEALHSPFMQIPGLGIDAARDLIDLGFKERYELYGRAPEALFEQVCQSKPNTPRARLYSFRLAIYYVEADEVDCSKLNALTWMD